MNREPIENPFIMKKTSLILIITFLLTQFGFSTSTYQPGDSMYVWAQSGLKMRVEPSLKGDKILTIPYGTKVQIDSYQNELPEIKVRVVEAQKIDGTEYKSFYLKGHWCKVTYLDTVGYIFDGYLSKMPTFQLEPYRNETEILHTVNESFDAYAEKHFGLLQKLNFDQNPELVNTIIERRIYGNGMMIEEDASEGGWTQKIILPSTSFEEGFLLFSLKYKFEDYAKSVEEDIYPAYRVTKKGTKFVEIEGYFQTVQIREVENVVIISIEEYAGC